MAEKAFSSHPGHGDSQRIANQAQRDVSGPTSTIAVDNTPPRPEGGNAGTRSGTPTERATAPAGKAYGVSK